MANTLKTPYCLSMQSLMSLRIAVAYLLCLSAIAGLAEAKAVPRVEGPWWHIASNPDLGKFNKPNRQPVDFAVWQAADGTWQLWSCIRNTDCGGNGRLFYCWQGKNLTDPDWQPKGIAMLAKPELGETPGGLQAPYVFQNDGKYLMAYGDWNNICMAASTDGTVFERIIQPSGKTGIFTEGRGTNTRDPMLIRIGDKWLCYYTAFHPPDANGRGYVFCRTSDDLKTWSSSIIVAYGGSAGNNIWSCECPHVVEYVPGTYYLFRTQRYGHDARTSVYCSTNPYNFGIDDDSYLVGTLPVAAPEIIRYNDEYYLAALEPDYSGIRIARLKWVQK
jgi:hypothetical protein